MAVNVQKTHQLSALIDTHTRKLRAELLSAMVCSEAGEPAPQRLHFRRAVESQESAERGRVSFLEMLGPLDAQQRHEQERQQSFCFDACKSEFLPKCQRDEFSPCT